MKNRRNFLKRSALLATGLAVVAPLMAKSGSEKNKSNDLPGIIFTEKEQGRWEGKAGSHVPIVKVEGQKIILITAHGMSEEHYIVRHTLVDSSGRLLGSKTFYPADKVARSSYVLPSGFHGKLIATSFCNKHDFWLKEFSV